MQSASDTFSEVLIISNWCKHCVRHRDGESWIGHARVLAEAPSTSIEYCEVYKIPKRAGSLWVPGPWSPGPLFIPTPSRDGEQFSKVGGGGGGSHLGWL